MAMAKKLERELNAIVADSKSSGSTLTPRVNATAKTLQNQNVSNSLDFHYSESCCELILPMH